MTQGRNTRNEAKRPALSGGDKSEELLDKIVLEAKALVLLRGSDEELKKRLRTRFIDTQDEGVRKFADLLQTRSRPGHVHLFLIAMGELLLASFLVFAGSLALIPAAAGIDTPAGLAQFFTQKAFGAVGSSPLAQYASFVEFAIGAVLILAALYSLRQAALNVKEAGLTVEPGGA